MDERTRTILSMVALFEHISALMTEPIQSRHLHEWPELTITRWKNGYVTLDGEEIIFDTPDEMFGKLSFTIWKLLDVGFNHEYSYSPEHVGGAEYVRFTMSPVVDTLHFLYTAQVCECDHTHVQNNTVCQFCYVRSHRDDVEALRKLVDHVKERF